MRILFITATRIGDAVLSTGLLDHLIRTWPQAKIVVACGPVAEGVFARMPNRAWTILLTKRRLRLHWLELWREVGLERWDLVVDLRGSAFAWLVRAKRRVVMRGGRQPGPRLGHLGALFGLNPPPLPVAWFNAADRARAATLLPGEGRWIGLGPTA
ncbi:MAG: glycosyltransferase family 9 protein, partial [Acetobacteraceae bacterium]